MRAVRSGSGDAWLGPALIELRQTTEELMRIRLLVILLLALLAGQVFLLRRSQARLRISDLDVDQRFPALRVAVVDRTAIRLLASTTVGECTLVVAISADCAVCQEARRTWAKRYRAWLDSAGVPVRPVWLAFSDSLGSSSFFAGFDFRGIGTFRVSDAPKVAAATLGLLATPTNYLLDRRGSIRAILLGDVLPSLRQARAVCRA